MILEKQTDIEILTDGDESQSSTEMSLDLDSAQMLMQMLSKNLYSDGIGSTIRETASNALDSHRRAGVTDPIVVSFGINKEANYEFSVEDFGSGLDHDDITNIISKYGKSTKRMEANALGMFGLGFKSPLAYSSSFYFICRKDGIERKYMMYEGEDVNTIDLLYESPTTERNGVKIIVPVKATDRYEFFKKIKEQLSYFESVYFDVKEGYNTIKNDFIISRGKSFQYSELNIDQKMHICLDNVYYPLDFDKLGIKPLIIPVGLRFGLTDGLFPTPNRESIRYTAEAKVVILNRIKEVADYYLEKFNKTIADSTDVVSIFNFFSESNRIVNSGINGVKFNITELIQYTSIKMSIPNIPGVNIISLKKLAANQNSIFGDFTARYRCVNGRITEIKSYWQKGVALRDMNHLTHMFEERLGGLKKTYLKSKMKPSEAHVFIKRDKPFRLLPIKQSLNGTPLYDNYFKLLSLNMIPRDQWRAAIKEFQYIQNLYLNKIDDVDKLVVPQAWLDTRKKLGLTPTISGSLRRVKLQGEVVCKQGVELLRYVDGKNSKLEPLTLKLEDIHKQKTLHVYGNQSEIEALDKLFHISQLKQKIKTLVFSERELRVIEKVNIHNLISLTEFMEGKNKPFKRLITGYLINKLVEEHPYLFANKGHLNGISTSFLSDIDSLLAYRAINYINAESTIYGAMLEVAEKNNLFDGDMYPEYQRIKTIIDRLPFLDPVMRTFTPYNRTATSLDVYMQKVLCDLFKYYKQKIDYTNYHLRLNDEPTEGEVLEEETIDQLIN